VIGVVSWILPPEFESKVVEIHPLTERLDIRGKFEELAGLGQGVEAITKITKAKESIPTRTTGNLKIAGAFLHR